MRKTACLVLLLTSSLLSVITAAAQGNDGNANVEMADVLRSNGKIYIVVAVLATILAGLFAYVIRLDRKISRLEKEAK
jgi:CcmD family protein